MVIIVENINRKNIKHIFMKNNQLEIEYISGLKYYFPSVPKSLLAPLLKKLKEAIELNKFQISDSFLNTILEIIQNESYSIKNSIIIKK